MRFASVAEVKDGLSEYLAHAKMKAFRGIESFKELLGIVVGGGLKLFPLVICLLLGAVMAPPFRRVGRWRLWLRLWPGPFASLLEARRRFL